MKKELLEELLNKIELLDKMRDDLTKLDPIQKYSGSYGRYGLAIPYTDEDITINGIIGKIEQNTVIISQAIENLKKCSISEKKVDSK